MKKLMCNILALCLLALVATGAQAADGGKKFVIYPFTVNAPQSYSYLSKAVPSTIQSQLNRPGTLQGSSSQAKAGNAAEAKKGMGQADYALWGSVNVLGNDCTIELSCIDRAGKTWSRSAQGPMSRMTGTIQQLSSAVGNEVLGVTVAARPAFMGRVQGQGQAVNQMNQNIVVNETGQQQVYLNPQFRYQGSGTGDGSRMRSQRLKVKMIDMAVGDFNGDGKNEVAVLDEHKLTIYLWQGDVTNGVTMKELGSVRVSQSDTNFLMRTIDLNGDKTKDFVIVTYEEGESKPYTYFYTFKGNKFSQVAERVNFFVGVLKTPPHFTPTLVGQAYDSVNLYGPGVRMVTKNGNKYTLGTKLNLPEFSNVFNLSWLPASKESKSDLLVQLTSEERLKVFQGTKFDNPIHATVERFSGSASGIDYFRSLPGMGIDRKNQPTNRAFAPLRMIPTDIGRTGEYVLLVNRPISTASEVFTRYRSFAQGEIHALFWDGVGLALKWKTRRIRGAVAQLDLADVNNDGILDLVVGLNTINQLGVGAWQSMVTAYPLDVSQADPNTPADMSDFEIAPSR